MTDDTNNKKVDEFRQTLTRLNRNVDVSEMSELDHHILKIFDQMDSLSKLKILLTCCMKPCAGMGGLAEPCELKPVEVQIEQPLVKDELSDIEKKNQEEMLRLKVWTAKAAFLGLLAFAGTGLVLMTMAGKDPTGALVKSLELSWKVLEVVFM